MFNSIENIKSTSLKIDKNASVKYETENMVCVKFSRFLNKSEKERIKNTLNINVLDLENFSFFKDLLSV